MNARTAWNYLMLCIMAVWIGVLMLWFFRMINAGVLIVIFLLGLAFVVYYMINLFGVLYEFEEFGAEHNKMAVVGSFLNFMMLIFVFYLLSWF